MPIPTYCWKDLSIDFVISLLILTDWKKNNYNLIFVIIDRLIKIGYYKLVKVTINTPSLVKLIINIMMRYHGLLNSIITNWRLLFTLKFWLLLYYFLDIKWRLLTIFYPQIDGQIKRQNNMIKAYFQAFVNFE